jgi:uncharacterized protein (DUF2267 family)
MKNWIIIIMICLGAPALRAQSKAQVMLEQIADLGTSLKTLKDGYKVVSNGLNKAKNLKGGTFNQHQDYFNSLKQINPATSNNPKIQLIAKYQNQIIALFQKEISWQQQQGILSKDEIDYLRRVYNNLLENCNTDIDELNSVAKPGTEMKDDERIKNIDRIYNATTDKYQFAQSFVHKTHALALDRKAEKKQRELIKKLYGIN